MKHACINDTANKGLYTANTHPSSNLVYVLITHINKMQHGTETVINKVKLNVKISHRFKFKHLTLISCLYLDLYTFKFEIKLKQKKLTENKKIFTKFLS